LSQPFSGGTDGMPPQPTVPHTNGPTVGSAPSFRDGPYDDVGPRPGTTTSAVGVTVPTYSHTRESGVGGNTGAAGFTPVRPSEGVEGATPSDRALVGDVLTPDGKVVVRGDGAYPNTAAHSSHVPRYSDPSAPTGFRPTESRGQNYVRLVNTVGGLTYHPSAPRTGAGRPSPLSPARFPTATTAGASNRGDLRPEQSVTVVGVVPMRVAQTAVRATVIRTPDGKIRIVRPLVNNRAMRSATPTQVFKRTMSRIRVALGRRTGRLRNDHRSRI
jgi:hypothetical protein